VSPVVRQQKRQRPGTSVEGRVLVKSLRRCAICFGLEGELVEKAGQLAHVDRNPENSVENNLVFLCLRHHDKYDSKPSQSKRYTAAEVKHFRSELYKLIKRSPPEIWKSGQAKQSENSGPKRQGMTLDLYEKRMQIYRLAKGFIAKVVREANPQFDELIKFIQEVDEATFLFDSQFFEYLDLLFKKAVRLRSLVTTMRAGKPGVPVEQLALEESEILIWFTEQFNELKTRAVPYMQWA
jgi:hypothetical protein